MEGQAWRLGAEVYCGRQIMRMLYTLFGKRLIHVSMITSEGNYRLKVAGTLERGICSQFVSPAPTSKAPLAR